MKLKVQRPNKDQRHQIQAKQKIRMTEEKSKNRPLNPCHNLLKSLNWLPETKAKHPKKGKKKTRKGENRNHGTLTSTQSSFKN